MLSLRALPLHSLFRTTIALTSRISNVEARVVTASLTGYLEQTLEMKQTLGETAVVFVSGKTPREAAEMLHLNI